MKNGNRMKRLYVLLPVLLFIIGSVSAQQGMVRGRVVEQESGEPLPGVTIMIEKSTRGVTTDIDGTFEIRAASTDKLIFSFLGMETQVIEVKDQRFIEVVMRLVTSELDEVTIVAFGKQKKESVIGSISTVSPKELKAPTSNLTTALAGKMAGVIAYQRSGEPAR